MKRKRRREEEEVDKESDRHTKQICCISRIWKLAIWLLRIKQNRVLAAVRHIHSLTHSFTALQCWTEREGIVERKKLTTK